MNIENGGSGTARHPPGFLALPQQPFSLCVLSPVQPAAILWNCLPGQPCARATMCQGSTPFRQGERVGTMDQPISLFESAFEKTIECCRQRPVESLPLPSALIRDLKEEMFEKSLYERDLSGWTEVTEELLDNHRERALRGRPPSVCENWQLTFC